ncbi:MAG TPA: DUF2177 family protein [Geminicoccaceae bacterium]
MQYFIGYVASAIVFFGLDLLWLGVVAKGFYARQLGDLLSDQPNMAVAGLFYAGYVGGIVLFAVAPALQAQSWTTALVLGVFLGLMAYGTYDMTNLATIRNWPVAMSITDMLWGSLLTGVAATAGFFAARWSGGG